MYSKVRQCLPGIYGKTVILNTEKTVLKVYNIVCKYFSIL